MLTYSSHDIPARVLIIEGQGHLVSSFEWDISVKYMAYRGSMYTVKHLDVFFRLGKSTYYLQ